jgi:hypothetical protein
MWGCSTCRSTLFCTCRIVFHCSPRPLWGILWYLIGIGRRVTITAQWVEGIRRIFEDQLPLVIFTGYSFMSPGILERCVPLDMKIKVTSVSHHLTVDLMSISMWLSCSISPYICLPPPVHSVQCGIETFRLRLAVQAMIWGVDVMLGVVHMPYQPSDALHDVTIPVFQTVSWLLCYLLSIWAFSSHSSNDRSSGMLAMRFWRPSQFWKFWKLREVFSSFGALSEYIFMPFYVIPQWI